MNRNIKLISDVSVFGTYNDVNFARDISEKGTASLLFCSEVDIT